MTTPAKTLRVIAVDDDVSVVKAFSMWVQHSLPFVELETYTDPLEALSHIDFSRRIDAIIADVSMPQMHGIEFLRKSLVKIGAYGQAKPLLCTLSAMDPDLLTTLDIDAIVMKKFTKPCPAKRVMAEIITDLKGAAYTGG